MVGKSRITARNNIKKPPNGFLTESRHAIIACALDWQRSSVVEQGNHNPLVGGSNPSAATISRL